MSPRWLSARAQVRADRAAIDARLDDLARVSLADGASPGELARAAWDLHHAYTALEAILERVLRLVDGVTPEGAASRVELLELAALEVDGLRPALVGDDAKRGLHELRSFRHFVRHGYSVELDAARLRALAATAAALRPLIARDLERLDAWLGALAGDA